MTPLQEIQFKIRNFFEHNREREAILVIHPDRFDELISELNPVTSATFQLSNPLATGKTMIQMYGLRMIVCRSTDAHEILIAKTFYEENPVDVDSMAKQIVDEGISILKNLYETIDKFSKIPDKSIMWIKHTNSGKWYLCEWSKGLGDNLGTARVIAGKNKGIGFHKHAINNQEFEDFIIVEKPQ